MSESAPWALANYQELTAERPPLLPHEQEARDREEQRSRINARIRRKLQKVI